MDSKILRGCQFYWRFVFMTTDHVAISA